MSFVIDASVVLAVLLDERGGNEVADALHGSPISVVNLSEVYRRLADGGVDLDLAVAAVDRLRLQPVDFDHAQSVETAGLRAATKHIGASFADRACLALGIRTGLVVLTADRKWDLLDLPIEIRQIR